MSFKEIINQDHIVNFLRASFRANRIAGAYLFIGKDGTGRVKMAKEFAKLINCKNASQDCCDECSQCKKIENESHIDVHWCRPVDNSIGIDQVRDLEKYIYLKPYEAQKKVFVISNAQCLTEESSNAILKTLEEPPSNSLLILIASDAATLLPTISSRCQKIIFNYVDEISIKDMLIHKYKTPLLHAHFISYLAEGSINRALDFKDLRDSLFEKRDHILNAISYKKFSVFKMEEFNIKDNAQMREGVCLLLDMLLAWFRDLLVVKSGLEAPLINLDKEEDLFKSNNKYTYEELIAGITNIANAKFLVNNNINAKMAISKLRADLWK